VFQNCCSQGYVISEDNVPDFGLNFVIVLTYALFQFCFLFCNSDKSSIFLKHAGELHIFVLRRENWSNYKNHSPTLTRMEDGRKKTKKDSYKRIIR
jgi:hypothetical protein